MDIWSFKSYGEFFVGPNQHQLCLVITRLYGRISVDKTVIITVICPARDRQPRPPLGRGLHGLQWRGQSQRQVSRSGRRRGVHKQLRKGGLQRPDPNLETESHETRLMETNEDSQ